mmetsp:Transcript_5854/g.6438  ORF Transcript_5854/g.6438 Transcript_5854/m.6438 type:complete len:339 (-) Transcript_5854:1500-2516(-)
MSPCLHPLRQPRHQADLVLLPHILTTHRPNLMGCHPQCTPCIITWAILECLPTECLQCTIQCGERTVCHLDIIRLVRVGDGICLLPIFSHRQILPILMRPLKWTKTLTTAHILVEIVLEVDGAGIVEAEGEAADTIVIATMIVIITARMINAIGVVQIDLIINLMISISLMILTARIRRNLMQMHLRLIQQRWLLRVERKRKSNLRKKRGARVDPQIVWMRIEIEGEEKQTAHLKEEEARMIVDDLGHEVQVEIDVDQTEIVIAGTRMGIATASEEALTTMTANVRKHAHEENVMIAMDLPEIAAMIKIDSTVEGVRQPNAREKVTNLSERVVMRMTQ